MRTTCCTLFEVLMTPCLPSPLCKNSALVSFLQLLYKAYNDLYFTYLEINPLGKEGAREEYGCFSWIADH